MGNTIARFKDPATYSALINPSGAPMAASNPAAGSAPSNWDKLPPDIIGQIADGLDEASRKKLRLATRSFKDVGASSFKRVITSAKWQGPQSPLAPILNKLPAVTSLVISTLNENADQELAQLAQVDAASLARIVQVRLGKHVTDAGLAHLQNLPQLKTLEVFGCPSITPAGLAHLQNLPKLESLKFYRCDSITYPDLAQLQNSPQLKTIHLEGELKHRYSDEQHLRSLMPGIKVFCMRLSPISD